MKRGVSGPNLSTPVGDSVPVPTKIRRSSGDASSGCVHGWGEELERHDKGKLAATMAESCKDLLQKAKEVQALSRLLEEEERSMIVRGSSTELWYKKRTSLFPRGIWRVSEHRMDDWRLEECNEELLALFRMSPDEIFPASGNGLSLLSLIAGKLRPLMSELMQTIAKTGAGYSELKTVLKVKAGDSLCLKLSITLVSRSGASKGNNGGYTVGEEGDVHMTEVSEGEASSPAPLSHSSPGEIQQRGAASPVPHRHSASACETTGCGAFRTDWSSDGVSTNNISASPAVSSPAVVVVNWSEGSAPEEVTMREAAVEAPCADSSTIEESPPTACCPAPGGTRRLLVSFQPCDQYDDGRVLGSDVHAKTFSVPSNEVSIFSTAPAQLLRRKRKP